MTVDPGQERVVTLRSDLKLPARPLTIDQAYAKAYANMRHLLKLSLESMPGDEVEHALRRAMQAWELCLETELAQLFYCPEVARILARPE